MTTEQIIQSVADEQHISRLRAMIVLTEILGKEKRPTGMGRMDKDCVPNFSIEELGWQ